MLNLLKSFFSYEGRVRRILESIEYARELIVRRVDGGNGVDLSQAVGDSRRLEQCYAALYMDAWRKGGNMAREIAACYEEQRKLTLKLEGGPTNPYPPGALLPRGTQMKSSYPTSSP